MGELPLESGQGLHTQEESSHHLLGKGQQKQKRGSAPWTNPEQSKTNASFVLVCWQACTQPSDGVFFGSSWILQTVAKALELQIQI